MTSLIYSINVKLGMESNTDEYVHYLLNFLIGWIWIWIQGQYPKLKYVHGACFYLFLYP